MKKSGSKVAKNPRYARQLSGVSCGPTAIVNAAKWAGFPCSLKKNHSFIVDLCECEEGTHPANFGRALKTMIGGPALSIWKRRGPSLKYVLEHVRKPDCAIILEYYYPKAGGIGGHYALVIGATSTHAICVNDRTDETVNKIPMSTFRRRFTRTRIGSAPFGWYDTTPSVWFLRKR